MLTFISAVILSKNSYDESRQAVCATWRNSKFGGPKNLHSAKFMLSRLAKNSELCLNDIDVLSYVQPLIELPGRQRVGRFALIVESQLPIIPSLGGFNEFLSILNNAADNLVIRV